MARITRYSCEETFRRMDDFLDRELSAAEVALVREHLAVCEECAHEYAFERSVLDSLRDRLRRVAVPSALVQRVLSRLR